MDPRRSHTLAIRQLHAKNIAHQDVKPSNVLDYRTDGHKLGDFGSAHLRARLPGTDPEDVVSYLQAHCAELRRGPSELVAYALAALQPASPEVAAAAAALRVRQSVAGSMGKVRCRSSTYGPMSCLIRKYSVNP